MPDAPTVPDRPTAAQLVELAHRATPDRPGPSLVSIRLDDDGRSVQLGTGPLPADRHPLDVLVGFRSPDDWDGVGIVATGAVHDLGAEPRASGRGRFSALVLRHGPGATLIEHDGGEVQLLDGDPTGWGADALRRVLGLPCAPPDAGTALLIDTWWLDGLVRGIASRPNRRVSWRWMSQAHPLCPPSTVLSPAQLSARSAAEASARPWAHLRSLTASGPLPAAELELPEGRLVAGDGWFDDGSLSRWLLRRTLPPDVLVEELVAHLPPTLVARLGAALVEIDLEDLIAV